MTARKPSGLQPIQTIQFGGLGPRALHEVPLPVVSGGRYMARYIPHHMVEEWYQQGWTFCRRLAGHHGHYSCLMMRDESKAAP